MALNPAATERGNQLPGEVESYPLLEALLHRRSRRFAKGMRLNGGPLAYVSSHAAAPLTLEEEAALAFAAGGTTGFALAELPYEAGDAPGAGGGNIMMRFVGRTAASGDALHTVIVFVLNDQGVWMLKRPQDFPRAEIADVIQAGREHRLVELYQKGRVQIADRRLDIPRHVPFVPSFNHWSANVPGTTYFLPMNEFTAIYINMLLTAFSEEFSYFVVDERNGFRPAGIARFARSRGGHLYEDPAAGRSVTVSFLEAWLYELVAVEQGGILQNLGLMAQALGLGGFPHFAAHPFIWCQNLGFRMDEIPLSQALGFGALRRVLVKALAKDTRIPSGVGLEKDGHVLIKPFCPPYYASMKEAVLAFLDGKFAEGKGTFRDGGAATAWRDPVKVQTGIPAYSDRTVAATIEYCEYIYRRYGRFPATCGPFRTVLAFQAHHLDPDFYDRFYRPEALTETQRQHGNHSQAGAA